MHGCTGVAKAMEKVREGETGKPSRSQPGLPETGREAGLGHGRERPPLATIFTTPYQQFDSPVRFTLALYSDPNFYPNFSEQRSLNVC